MLKLPVYGKTQTFTILSGVLAKIVARAFTGNDLVLSFAVVDEDGDAVDVSAWTTRNFALYTTDSDTAVFTKTPAFTTDGTDGLFTVTIATGDTSAIDAGVHRIEIQVAGTGIKSTIVRGTIIFQKTYA